MVAVLVRLTILTGLLACVTAFHGTPQTGCKDRYIWIADGSVECKYLEISSFWGLAKDPERWCNRYSQTDCCETCIRLGFMHKGSPIIGSTETPGTLGTTTTTLGTTTTTGQTTTTTTRSTTRTPRRWRRLHRFLWRSREDND